MTRRCIPIHASGGPYQVVIDPDGFDGFEDFLRRRLSVLPGAAVVVTDSNVGPMWGRRFAEACPSLALHVITLPAGEAHKTLATWEQLVGDLLSLGIDRGTPVLALGGGVVGDVAGFAAACTLRGLPFVPIPTTLLAMVDASVGGKTAVNLPHGKNLVGAFHPPSLVWAALPTLATLPPVERVNGLGEVLKTALIGAPELLADLEAGAPDLSGLVSRCVEVKARIVAEDERESGLRAVLNAGHTVGHALETALGHGVLPHGHAVGIGLVCEARYAVHAGVCADPRLPDRIAAVARGLGLPTALPDVDEHALERAVRFDKKGSQDTLTVPLPVRAGVYTLVRVPWSRVPDLWKFTA